MQQRSNLFSALECRHANGVIDPSVELMVLLQQRLSFDAWDLSDVACFIDQASRTALAQLQH